jgi:hypothetical protein
MSSDFGFTLDDLSNSAALTSKIGDGYNPDGRESLRTSSSLEGYEDQSLTTRDVTEIMSRRRLN